MAYTKTLITDPRPTGFTDYDTERLYEAITKCNTNFTAIEQAMTDIAVEGTADAVGAMVTGNTETGISVSYQDDDNTLDFVVDAEWVADTVGAMFSSNTETGVTATYQDDDNTIDLALGDHAHAGVAGDGGTLSGYQATLTASSTLADLGVATIDPAFSGVLTGITNASTLAQLLAAIDSHAHGG